MLRFLRAEPRLDLSGVGRVLAWQPDALIAVDSGDNTVTTSKGAQRASRRRVHRYDRAVGDAAVVLCSSACRSKPCRRRWGRGVGTLCDPRPAADQLMSDETDELLRVSTSSRPTSRSRASPAIASRRSAARLAADQLMQRGCGSVVITLAARGAFYASRRVPTACSSRRTIDATSSVDPTGAGAFCGARSRTRAAPTSMTLREANVASAATTVRGGTVDAASRAPGGAGVAAEPGKGRGPWRWERGPSPGAAHHSLGTAMQRGGAGAPLHGRFPSDRGRGKLPRYPTGVFPCNRRSNLAVPENLGFFPALTESEIRQEWVVCGVGTAVGGQAATVRRRRQAVRRRRYRPVEHLGDGFGASGPGRATSDRDQGDDSGDQRRHRADREARPEPRTPARSRR